MPRCVIDVETLQEFTDLTDGTGLVNMEPPTIDLTLLDEDDEIEEVPPPNTPPLRSPPTAINPNIGKIHPSLNLHYAPSPLQASSSKRTNEVIELDSDGETSQSKAAKHHDEDSDDNYADLHDAFVTNHSRNWQAFNPHNDDFGFCHNPGDIFQGTNLTLEQSTYPAPKVLQQQSRTEISSEYVPVWEALRLAVHKKPTSYSKSWSSHQTHKPLPFQKVRLVDQFKLAPGAINKIAQRNGHVVVGSASLGGQPDQPHETVPDPHNRDGALMVWNSKKDPYVLSGHKRTMGEKTKFYAINNLSFDSHSNVFVSVGNDKTVQVWDYNEAGKYVHHSILQTCSSVPTEIAFQHKGPAFAVGERKLHIWSGLDKATAESSSVQVGKRKGQEIGAIAWGEASTKDIIFAASVPTGDGYDGVLQAFDSCTQSSLWTIKSKAGCCMSIKPGGEMLASITQADEHSYRLNLFDAKHAYPSFHDSVPLHFSGDSTGEAAMASWSPDGIFLAVAQSDNSTCVYDTRMLSEDPLFVYQHTGPSAVNPGHESYGVVSAQWITSLSESERLYLVTGGDDGCIRHWNPLMSNENTSNGSIIVQAESDIAALHIGDQHQDQYPFVVGDGSGQVYIYDTKEI